MAVLAGGRATRLGALAEQLPKVLQPVGGRPFLDVLLSGLGRRGCRRVHLCLGHLAERVEEHLRVRPGHAVAVSTSTESGAAGTAGALVGAADHLDEVFAVVMGDTYLEFDVADLVRQLPPGALGLMLVTRAATEVPANVAVRDGLVTAYDKHGVRGGLTDTGVAVLRKEALRLVAHRPLPADLAELFGLLIDRGQLAATVVDCRFFDIGTPERIQVLNDWLSDAATETSQEQASC